MNAAERFFFEGEPTFSPTTGAGLSKDVWARIEGLGFHTRSVDQ